MRSLSLRIAWLALGSILAVDHVSLAQLAGQGVPSPTSTPLVPTATSASTDDDWTALLLERGD